MNLTKNKYPGLNLSGLRYRNNSEESGAVWFRRFKQALPFFALSLIVLSLWRTVMYFCYASGEQNITFIDFLPALWTGFRVDLKWLCLFIAPAWLLFICSYKFNFFYRIAQVFAIIAVICLVLLDAVNFGFFSFYSTPISALVFGLFQDDTKAIITTLLSDWPLETYLLVIFSSVFVPVLFAAFCFKKSSKEASFLDFIVIAVVCTIFIGISIRGSLGKFPLRQENFAVSKYPVINALVPNGVAALYEANKARKALEIKGEPIQAITKAGFKDRNEAIAVLPNREEIPAIFKDKPNVVFALMEGMGIDLFISHNRNKNNTLGALESALGKAVVYKKAISIQNGTFPSLEGLIFDTPLSPISQSVWGRKKLSFSNVWDFKNKGYKTIFLTGAPDSWRQVSETFKFYGFDEVIAEKKILATYKDAEVGPWGIGDKWVFKYAFDLLEKAEKNKQPLFLFILSTTNHPPYKVPDGDKSLTVNRNMLDPYIEGNKEEIEPILQTYQYASEQLGQFVHDVDNRGYDKNTIIVASGDHNTRLKRRIEGNWHKVYGVPIIFWLPPNLKLQPYDTSKWVSHFDIFPTLKALALGGKEKSYKGRNLFNTSIPDHAFTFNPLGGSGFIISERGAVVLNNNSNNFSCFNWSGNHDRLVKQPKCSPEQIKDGRIGLATRALLEYDVRSGLKN